MQSFRVSFDAIQSFETVMKLFLGATPREEEKETRECEVKHNFQKKKKKKNRQTDGETQFLVRLFTRFLNIKGKGKKIGTNTKITTYSTRKTKEISEKHLK